MDTSFRASRGALALLLIMACAACDIPRDPRDTLASVRGDTLDVGVSEAPPWVVRPHAGPDAEPEGVEPELVRRFAESIDAEIRWHWGAAEDHYEALTFYQLDLAIGGLTRASPWARHLGTTQPFHSTDILLSAPPGGPAPSQEAIEGERVAVPPATAIGGYIMEEGGVPVPTRDLRSATGWVGAPRWQLASIGRDTTGWLITGSLHVLAAPPGENAFLMALENVLHEADVEALLPPRGGGEVRP